MQVGGGMAMGGGEVGVVLGPADSVDSTYCWGGGSDIGGSPSQIGARFVRS